MQIRLMSIIILFLTIALALTGCGPLNPFRVNLKKLEYNSHKIERNYAIGEARQALVGEPILKVKDYWQINHPPLIADRDATLKIPPVMMKVPIPKGSKVHVIGTIEKDNNNYRVIHIQHPNANMLRFLLTDEGMFQGSAVNIMGERMGWTYKSDPPDLRFLHPADAVIDSKKDWTSFQLIYTGATRDTISLTYSEYDMEGIEKPKSTETLSYDRNTATITFKKIVIKLVEIDTQHIKYIVQQDELSK